MFCSFIATVTYSTRRNLRSKREALVAEYPCSLLYRVVKIIVIR
ncbi:hypothetical protein [Sigmofec virus UA08Rod_5530]|uniref:Uncharacterized protein n=1 Tax=Sigmofec virus UA08Rod_5530 TaxID=2929427 RepID=A0A976N1F3_9VIRU|nr:hypothetical protein [Sigmofec virus UA08Rod_5530]